MVHTHVALKRLKKLQKGVSVGAFVKALTSQSFQVFFSARLSWALKKIFFSEGLQTWLFQGGRSCGWKETRGKIERANIGKRSMKFLTNANSNSRGTNHPWVLFIEKKVRELRPLDVLANHYAHPRRPYVSLKAEPFT